MCLVKKHGLGLVLKRVQFFELSVLWGKELLFQDDAILFRGGVQFHELSGVFSGGGCGGI
jgi:hypothetical protein